MTIEYKDSKRIVGLSDGVSNGYDVANISYSGKSSSSSSQNTYMLGIGFNEDGTKMYRTGYSPTKAIFQYTLSTAWDISTSSYDNVSFSLPNPIAVPYGIEWNGDGTKFVIGDNSTGDLFQFTLSTAYDISTTNSTPTTYDPSETSKPVAFKFFNNGLNAFLVSQNTDYVYKYTLSTAYDISTMSYATNSLSYTGSYYISGMEINSDGTELYLMDHIGNSLRRYTLSTAYDLSTASLTSSFSTSSQFSANTASALRFSADGTKLYISGYGASDFQYDTGSTASDRTLLTNVQDNSLFVEKDTARRYWFDANPLLDDDFSTDDWTDSGANVGISNGVMNFDIDRTTTDQSSYYQLSRALSDTKWTMRLHDVIVTTKSGGVEVFIGVSSNTSGAQTAQDFIGLNLGDNTANPVLGGVDSDGAVIARLAGDYTYSLSTTYNIEIIRESATSYRIKVFSNSGFDSTALFSQSYTCTATTTGLQYVKFANGQIAGSTENIIGTCSKVEIFDGVTTASGGGEWTMQPTFEDDYDYTTQTLADVAWVPTDTAKIRVNITNDNLAYTAVNDGSNDLVTHDLGASVSETKWVLRWKQTISTLTDGGTNQTRFCIGLGDTITGASTNQDFIGMYIGWFNTSAFKYYYTNWANGGRGDTANSTQTSLVPATGTKYYELIRTSASTFEFSISSTSAYTKDVLATQTITGVTATGLRYIKMFNREDGSGGAQIIGTVDDISFYNGVNTIN